MMCELPEVETVRRELDRDLVGKKVKTVEAASMAVLKGASTHGLNQSASVPRSASAAATRRSN